MHSGSANASPQAVELLNVATGPDHRPVPATRSGPRPAGVEPGLAHARRLRRQSAGRRPCAPTTSRPGAITTPSGHGCDPGYVGARLAFRASNLATQVGPRRIANARTLTVLLHRDVEQTPAPTAAAGVLAIPATTITPAGGAPPVTTVVLFNAAGRVVGTWDTGGLAQSIELLAGGRVIAASGRDGVVLEDRRTGGVVTSVAGRPIVAVAASPRGDVLGALRRTPDRLHGHARAPALRPPDPHRVDPVDAVTVTPA